MLGGCVSKRMGIPEMLVRRGLGSSDDQCHSGALGRTAGTSLVVSEPLPEIPTFPLLTVTLVFYFKAFSWQSLPCHAHLDTQQGDFGGGS